MRSDRADRRISETLECLDVDITDCSKIAASIGDEFLVYLLDMAILHVRRRAVGIEDQPKDASAQWEQPLLVRSPVARPNGRRPAAYGRRAAAPPTADVSTEAVIAKISRADSVRRIAKDAEASSHV
jgi:hypothetical protein